MEQTQLNPNAPETSRKVALIGTYTPRKCGIATFSADIAETLRDLDSSLAVDIVAMCNEEPHVYPAEVTCQIREAVLDDYFDAAAQLNAGGYAAILIQHEYGIFGGVSGDFLLSLMRKLEAPIITTLHTVLEDPAPSERDVMIELIALSTKVIVMSKTAIRFLDEVYGVELAKVELIPHGVPPITRGNVAAGRELLGKGSPNIFTFGFLSPDKGIQHCIRAMPEILKQFPNARYTVMGQTHPNILKSQGDAYRQGLIALAEELGVSESVSFVNRFVTSKELVDCLSAMDYYVTPYLNPRQITSGTLAYSVGAGKAVISTPYWYAKEMLAEDRGVLVPFADSSSIARAVLHLEHNLVERQEMSSEAAKFGEQMQWPRVGERYLELVEQAGRISLAAFTAAIRVTSAVIGHQAPTLAPKLSHLRVLSDDTGIYQHAVYDIPCRYEGYCVDDNARALLFTLECEREGSLTDELSLLQSRYLAFVLSAYNPSNKRFRNFMSFERAWLELEGSEDSHGRSVWSLGVCAAQCSSLGRRRAAMECFRTSAPELLNMTSPRAWTFGLLGMVAYIDAYPSDRWVAMLMRELTARLLRLYNEYSKPDWNWFENGLAYDNARMSQALIKSGASLQDEEMMSVGLTSLRWLVDIQTDEFGQFSPIGSDGFYRMGGKRALFDQQPVEAWATTSACLSAHLAEPNDHWLAQATQAHAWFLGENCQGQPVAVVETGGCRDGIHPDRLNENQGAESTLSYLCSFMELSALRQVAKTSAGQTV